MSIIAKYKFNSTLYANLLPIFNDGYTGYTVTDDEATETDSNGNIIVTRTIECDTLPTLMRFGRVWVEGELATDDRTDSLLEILEMNTSELTSCNSMFRYCTNLTSINCDFNTSNVTNMYAMFTYCQSLTSLDVSNFDTSKVTSMREMFYNCQSLTSLDVSNFNTSNVTSMVNMFTSTPLLTDIGMLYCSSSTINTISSNLPTTHTQTIWVQDVDINKLTSVSGVEFKEYKENSVMINLSSPLFNGDRIEVIDGKLCHYHKMGMIEYQEGDLDNYITDLVNTVYELVEPYYEEITPLQSDIVLETYLESNLDIYTKLPIKTNVSYITNVPSLSTLSMRATEMKESDNIIANLTNMLDNEINE